MKYLSILLLGLVLSCKDKEITQYEYEEFIIKEKVSVRQSRDSDGYYFKSIDSEVIEVTPKNYILYDKGDTLIIVPNDLGGFTEIKDCKRIKN